MYLGRRPVRTKTLSIIQQRSGTYTWFQYQYRALQQSNDVTDFKPENLHIINVSNC